MSISTVYLHIVLWKKMFGGIPKVVIYFSLMNNDKCIGDYVERNYRIIRSFKSPPSKYKINIVLYYVST